LKQKAPFAKGAFLLFGGSQDDASPVSGSTASPDGRPSPAGSHHTAFALDQFKLRQPQQITDMIDASLSALMSLFLIFGLEGWQFELLQMVLQEKLRLVGGLAHAAAPCRRAA
jgi:hypothetical protein